MCSSLFILRPIKRTIKSFFETSSSSSSHTHIHTFEKRDFTSRKKKKKKKKKKNAKRERGKIYTRMNDFGGGGATLFFLFSSLLNSFSFLSRIQKTRFLKSHTSSLSLSLSLMKRRDVPRRRKPKRDDFGERRRLRRSRRRRRRTAREQQQRGDDVVASA